MTGPSPTIRITAVKKTDRWLYRREGNDYGPVSTDELLKAIEARTVDLQTQVYPFSTMRWEAAAAHQILRDYFDKCADKWRAAELEESADQHVKRLARARKARTGIWRTLVIGIVVSGAFGGWLVYRLSQAEPMGLDRLVKRVQMAPMPSATLPPTEGEPFELAAGTPVKRLFEHETYDTGGVGFEGDGGAAAVTKVAFSEDGRVAGQVPSHVVNQVIASARKVLTPCARNAASADRSFKGTRVTFSIAPGKLTGLTVGAEVKRKPAFRACVKTALRRVKVPAFSGGSRRVTIPLKVAW